MKTPITFTGNIVTKTRKNGVKNAYVSFSDKAGMLTVATRGYADGEEYTEFWDIVLTGKNHENAQRILNNPNRAEHSVSRVISVQAALNRHSYVDKNTGEMKIPEMRLQGIRFELFGKYPYEKQADAETVAQAMKKEQAPHPAELETVGVPNDDLPF